MGKDGKSRNWLIECANPGILNRAGWKFNMINKDDQITLVVSPLRTGEPGALLQQIKLPRWAHHRQRRPRRPAEDQHRGRQPLPDAKPTTTDGTPP